jgi:hypothetical protein
MAFATVASLMSTCQHRKEGAVGSPGEEDHSHRLQWSPSGFASLQCGGLLQGWPGLW